MSNEAEDSQAPVIAHFARGAKRIDTQGAIILLKGDAAIKIRRAIRLPFLDYSTLEKRRAAAEAEIALNRPYAPHIYIDSAPIRRTRDGYGFEGDGEIVEWATRMRRFDENATLDKLARDQLTGSLISTLARKIHAMHEKAPRREAEPAIASMRTWIEQNAESFAARPELFPAEAAQKLAERSRVALDRAAPLLRARGARGFVRRCHGDLHLGNLVMIAGEPTPFDAIEFDDAIATGDVLYDLAFVAMDLWERDLKPQANLLLNAYLAREAAESYDGLAAMPLFLSLRAAIRAKVEANALVHSAAPEKAAASARRYFDFAVLFLAPAPARLVAVGGLSGAGKSALAARLAPDIGMAPGAIWLRSDVERKAMFGVDEETHLPPDAYSAEATRETYARIRAKALRALGCGAAALIDATHATAAERAESAALAQEAGVPFHGLWLDAPLEARLSRIAGRRGDASDADAEVARRQRADPLREPGWRAIDASGDLAATLRRARVALDGGAGV
jgi:aminoglycoside phosphotransferase family enzyme/predicted kinase